MVRSNKQPKLRSDLVVSEQETTAGPSFVIKDPASGRFFRLREPEHFIARQFDGSTHLDAIRRRAKEKFGAGLRSLSIGMRQSVVEFSE